MAIRLWKKVAVTLSCAFMLLPASALAGSIKGRIVDKSNSSGLPYSTVVIVSDAGVKYRATSDAEGYFVFDNLTDGHYSISVTYVGYISSRMSCTLKGQQNLIITLKPDSKELNEVVVTAREGQGITTSSIIDRKAIEHLQPSSFTDLLALLPGGSTQLPDLTNANSIHLRQAGTGSSDYDISSLGTVFVTDGIPISANANMQQVRQASSSLTGDPDAGRNHTATGVDMRTIPTDNIESVEVIRGIAPAEYGDLTSGVVVINRKLMATPLEARFKADSYSKLLYIGKGIQKGNLILNLGADYLDAKQEPSNSLDNYKRLTLSARLQNTWKLGVGSLRWRWNTDYTGSFDKEKHDAEILKQKDDRYKSDYNRFAMSHSLLFTASKDMFLKSLNFDIAMAYESSQITQDKQISLSRDVAASTTLAEGEHDGVYLPYQYMAHVTVDGKPLNVYAKLKGLFALTTGRLTQNFNAGVEWRMDKNYGHGQEYDPAYPISPGTPYRPRNYSSIPASHQLGAYAQDVLTMPVGANKLTASLGLRAASLAGLDSRYRMAGKWYLDPRLNVQWQFPSVNISDKPLVIDINGGWGMQTKFPTLLQTYPDLIYNDIIELNYYNQNPDYRRLYLRTYVINPTNYAIGPARNRKWEVRLGSRWNGYSFSFTYFRESLTSGFRSSTQVQPFDYRDYNENAIDGNTLKGKPDLASIPYIDKTVLGSYSQTTNGSKLVKQGIEWQLSTRRFNAIKTRVTINGAWFRTTYTNSEPMFQSNTTAVVNGTPVNDLYIGYYDNTSGSVRQQFNTNFMTDTYLPKLGLAFSLTAECTWFTMSQAMRVNGVPTAYMTTDGKVYPYTDESRHDTYLQWLVKNYNESGFAKQRVPFWMFLNLKVTKDFGKWMRLALFIDRMIDYMPDYETNSGLTIRRTSKPYFGMEINFTI